MEPKDELSPRQREVAILLAEGLCVKEIAALLKVSKKTAEYHRAAIYTAWKVNNPARVTRRALQLGLLPLFPHRD